MNAYAPSKARSEAKSEISHVLSDPNREMEARWNRWFEKLTPAQQRFVLTEHENPESPGYGPDSPAPDLN